MKIFCYVKHSFFVSLFMMLVTLVLFVSCEKAYLGTDVKEGEGSSGESGMTHKVKVITRSSSPQQMVYPVDIYAYDQMGKEVAHQTVSSGNESISMSLKEGQYTIAAVSGMSSLDQEKGYSTLPIMTGSTLVNVGASLTGGSSTVTANIVLSYAVASLNLSLIDVPQSVNGVSVTVASQYSKVSNLREYSGSTAVTIPCTKTGDSWQTGTVYLLPGCKENTSMTVTLSMDSGTSSYGITYPSAFKAATPYRFTGSYSSAESDVKITGSLGSEDWQTTVDDSFSFGPSGNNSFNGQQGLEVIKVGSLPVEGTIWNGHLVALVNDSEGSGSSAEVLFVSITEWSSLTSALYETDPTVAHVLAENYVEGDLSGWRIPTNDQVKELRLVWSSDNLSILNDALAGVDGSIAIAATDEDGKNVRYLSEDASYTYTWAKGGSIVAAGKTVKTYRLRLVKIVKMIL